MAALKPRTRDQTERPWAERRLQRHGYRAKVHQEYQVQMVSA